MAERKIVDNQVQKRCNTSNVRKHFGFYLGEDEKPDRSKTICKICFSATHYVEVSTSNLKTHLSNYHNDVVNPPTDCKPKNDQPSIAQQFAKANVKPMARDSAEYKSLTNKVVKWIIFELLPLSTIEKPSFRDMVSSLNPRYTAPCTDTLTSRYLPEMYSEVKGKILQNIDGVKFFACTTDGWTSSATQSYITVTLHYVDDEWSIAGLVLQTKLIEESHTAINLADFLQTCFHEWGTRDRFIIGMTDNAKNITNAWQNMDRLSIPCFAHTLNLAVNKVLKVGQVANVMAHARKLVAQFHYSTTLAASLKAKQQLLKVPVTKLVSD